MSAPPISIVWPMLAGVDNDATRYSSTLRVEMGCTRVKTHRGQMSTGTRSVR